MRVGGIRTDSVSVPDLSALPGGLATRNPRKTYSVRPATRSGCSQWYGPCRNRINCCLSLRAEGLRYREIAEVLGISLGSVAASLEKSLSRLQAGGKQVRENAMLPENCTFVRGRSYACRQWRTSAAGRRSGVDRASGDVLELPRAHAIRWRIRSPVSCARATRELAGRYSREDRTARLCCARGSPKPELFGPQGGTIFD